MQREHFMTMLDAEHSRIVELQMTKGKEYAPDHDATLNFKRRAEKLNVTPEIVWAIFAGKHWDFIDSYCATGEVLSDEPVEARIRDLILYLYLLLAMVADKAY